MSHRGKYLFSVIRQAYCVVVFLFSFRLVSVSTDCVVTTLEIIITDHYDDFSHDDVDG